MLEFSFIRLIFTPKKQIFLKLQKNYFTNKNGIITLLSKIGGKDDEKIIHSFVVTYGRGHALRL